MVDQPIAEPVNREVLDKRRSLRNTSDNLLDIHRRGPNGAPSLSQMAWNAVTGAAAGQATGTIGNALKRMVAPVLGPLAQRLADAGVRMTPGQMAGGMAQRAENAAMSLPLVGSRIRGAQVGSIASSTRLRWIRP